jgi:hypothetical protein
MNIDEFLTSCLDCYTNEKNINATIKRNKRKNWRITMRIKGNDKKSIEEKPMYL